MKRLAVGLAVLLASFPAQAQDNEALRSLYQELVETDTSITTGSCTALADKVEVRLRAAGYGDADITRFAVPDHPKEGGLVVVLPGTSKTLKPILLLGHIDVVAAKREDWTRDPYKLVEEKGYFWGRGTADMKALDAIWIDTMLRLKLGKAKLKRTLKLALTCGEETSWAFNGAKWLAENKPDLIAAEFALNEGGGGRTDGKGKLLTANLHVGEKTAVNYRIEATNPGGHSSAPVKDNAIYELSDALVKVREFEFPLMMTDTTKAYFARAGAARGDDMGKAMIALAANPGDKAAEAIVNTDKAFHSMLRTTCVATLIDGGHANNALPQRAGANINCRIFPGVSAEAVRDELVRVIADPRMTVTLPELRGPLARPVPLDPKIVKPIEKLLAKHRPGVPLVPMMSTGATDGVFLEAIGIPSYGPPGTYSDPDGNGTHGLNERLAVDALYSGRAFLFELVTVLGNQD
ncbi:MULTISPECIES: M20/M25/M40 family metallo-hydrolase [Sphingomonas]|uniref:Acetylornithine deacetylase/succinyl-diaminopimelate desuccinylase-like protein n=1 Tax=Sphingomonas kyeonggiensis TaxID=1268553 RepID=A0A7W7JY45_9SPHN|nr:M20/M25/M40 family metallo-hydrolase [Sphingomonas kyeonggiensis]MBB4837506.1 acetylornithine deacetylase/succinyl-diaminopimelate desuccinylase-like protein [Sphingomonas kyeonggiensis]